MPLLGESVVEWGALLKVLWTATVAGVGVTAAFALSILGAARTVELRRDGHPVVSAAYAVMMIVGFLTVGAALVFAIVLMAAR